MNNCPDREKCHTKHHVTKPGYRCGFEIAGTCHRCPKRKREAAND